MLCAVNGEAEQGHKLILIIAGAQLSDFEGRGGGGAVEGRGWKVGSEEGFVCRAGQKLVVVV